MYFNKYFKDFQDTWKGLTDITTLKTFSSNVPGAPSISDITTTNSSDIANSSNNYFTSTAKETKYSHKHYSDYFKDKCTNSFFNHTTK